MSEKSITKRIIKDILNKLAKKDHFFVSELHFQTEFIIEASKQLEGCLFYPEYKPSKEKRPGEFNDISFDLLIKTSSNEKVLIEFKYLTADYEERLNDDITLSVKNQQAWDLRRYDCWNDIHRIESFVEKQEITEINYGFFILITNDYHYWEDKQKITSNGYSFKINEGSHNRNEKHYWDNPNAKSITEARKVSIEIKNDYVFEYDDFYGNKEKTDINGYFKSLVVAIPPEDK